MRAVCWKNGIAIAVVVAISALLTGCGGGDASGNETPSTGTSVGAGGGTIASGAVTLTVPNGALTSETRIGLKATQDSSVAAIYEEGSWIIGPGTALDSSEYEISLDQAVLGDSSTLKFSMTVPPDLAGRIKDGALVTLTYLNAFSSDDPEAEESETTVEIVASQYDPATGIVSGDIPTQAFGDASNGGGLRAVVKLAIETSSIDVSSPTSVGSDGRQHALATKPCECASGIKGAYGMCYPEAVSSSMLSPLEDGVKLVIVAPWDEPGHSKSTSLPLGNHTGIDFRAVIGTQVKASGGGYVEAVVKSSTKAGQYVILRHSDGSVTRYLHLKEDSVGVGNSVKAPPSQSNWRQAVSKCGSPLLPVAAGQRIALSGDTGGVKEHLHFEFGFGLIPGANLPTGRINPIGYLGTIGLETPSGMLSKAPYVVEIGIPKPTATEAATSTNSELVHVAMYDSNGVEITVRRQFAPAEVLLPVTAQGKNFVGKPLSDFAYSNWPVVTVNWVFADEAFGGVVRAATQLYPSYPIVTNPDLNTKGVVTDSGDLLIAASAFPTQPNATVVGTVTVLPVKRAKVAPAGGNSLASPPGGQTNAPKVVSYEALVQSASVDIRLGKTGWVWLSGPNVGSPTTGSPQTPFGTYGSMGVPGATNQPGARFYSNSWVDLAGDFWVFGGAFQIGQSNLNDLWRYSNATGQWTWMSGAKTPNSVGNYGAIGVASTANSPSARYSAGSWTDGQGDMWLYGGSDAGGYPNDLWLYKPSFGTWTLVSGSRAILGNGAQNAAVYGSKGTASAANSPGGRQGAVTWTDLAGNLWLFGGLAVDSNAGLKIKNDLWKFDPKAGTWTWVAGSKTPDSTPVYGTQGTAAAGNTPDGRQLAAGWVDLSGNLWLYGGTDANLGNPSDLWKFDPSISAWAWMGGLPAQAAGNPAIFGTRGLSASGNSPGARSGSLAWTDLAGNLWLFGGRGNGPPVDGHVVNGIANDVWKYSPSEKGWAWVRGSNAMGSTGAYGTQGVLASSNNPGARSVATGSVGKSGKLWLYGGVSTDAFGDLWNYQP